MNQHQIQKLQKQFKTLEHESRKIFEENSKQNSEPKRERERERVTHKAWRIYQAAPTWKRSGRSKDQTGSQKESIRILKEPSFFYSISSETARSKLKKQRK